MEKEILIAVFASTGFWGLITALVQHYWQRKSDYVMMMRGLGHDRICSLGEFYIMRGYITRDEYENLVDYLYIPNKVPMNTVRTEIVPTTCSPYGKPQI